MAAAWYRIEDGGRLILTLHVQPGARRTEVVGLHGDALKLRLAAPPVEGKANAELIRFLAAALGVAPRAVTLVAGDASRRKRVAVTGPARPPQALLPGWGDSAGGEPQRRGDAEKDTKS
ncbi:MAG TPA: DUF167 domain-containing protein [Pelomicrobium sp.]|nr:DUF167 domain-containing protein [Pelomicrobium sp.]